MARVKPWFATFYANHLGWSAPIPSMPSVSIRAPVPSDRMIHNPGDPPVRARQNAIHQIGRAHV